MQMYQDPTNNVVIVGESSEEWIRTDYTVDLASFEHQKSHSTDFSKGEDRSSAND
jgi:hypothetical protein